MAKRDTWILPDEIRLMIQENHTARNAIHHHRAVTWKGKISRNEHPWHEWIHLILGACGLLKEYQGTYDIEVVVIAMELLTNDLVLGHPITVNDFLEVVQQEKTRNAPLIHRNRTLFALIHEKTGEPITSLRLRTMHHLDAPVEEAKKHHIDTQGTRTEWRIRTQDGTIYTPTHLPDLDSFRPLTPPSDTVLRQLFTRALPMLQTLSSFRSDEALLNASVRSLFSPEVVSKAL